MLKLLYVGIGGFIGSCLRYIITLNSTKLYGTQFPYGTLTVNALGGLAIGFILEMSLTSDAVSPELKLLLTTGVMGGLTTFSTFSYETVTFFSNGKYIMALLNTGLNLFLGFGGVILGKFIVRVIK